MQDETFDPSSLTDWMFSVSEVYIFGLFLFLHESLKANRNKSLNLTSNQNSKDYGTN